MSFVLYFLGINVKSNPYLLTNFLVFLTPVVSLSYNNTIFYHNLDNGLTIDLAKKTNDIAATPIDFNINATNALIFSIKAFKASFLPLR